MWLVKDLERNVHNEWKDIQQFKQTVPHFKSGGEFHPPVRVAVTGAAGGMVLLLRCLFVVVYVFVKRYWICNYLQNCIWSNVGTTPTCHFALDRGLLVCCFLIIFNVLPASSS